MTPNKLLAAKVGNAANIDENLNPASPFGPLFGGEARIYEYSGHFTNG
jgi:hypothetical protein